MSGLQDDLVEHVGQALYAFSQLRLARVMNERLVLALPTKPSPRVDWQDGENYFELYQNKRFFCALFDI